jgi:hypothetical protein
MAQQLRNLLPGSDVKTGPLSDLGDAGRGLALRLAEGIAGGASVAVKQVAALSGAMSDEIGLAMGRADLGVRGMAIGNRGLGTFATVPAVSNVNTYNVTVNTAATSGTYLADVMLARALAG